MSTTETSISRPVALLIGGLVGVVALYLGWVFLVQPLLESDVAGAPQPSPTDVAPLPPEVPPAPPGADDTAELDSLLDLDQVESEQYQIAGARDPFRQVVIEAQVDEPATTDGATPGATPGTTDGGTGSAGGGGTTGSTGGGSTGGGSTGGGSGSTGGDTSTGTDGDGSTAADDGAAGDGAADDGAADDGAADDGAADDSAADGDAGEMTAGGTELAATGLDTDMQAMLGLTLLLSGGALLFRTRRQG